MNNSIKVLNKAIQSNENLPELVTMLNVLYDNSEEPKLESIADRILTKRDKQ